MQVVKCTPQMSSLSSVITRTGTILSNIHQKLYINSIFACRCISSIFMLQDATVLPCPASNPFEVEFQTEIPTFLIDYMRHRFHAVLQEIHWDGSQPNFKWTSRHLFLKDAQVQELAVIVRFGLGNRSVGKAEINVDHGYRYRPGDRPWFHYNDGPDYSNQPVLEHSWRIKYLCAEFLRNYFDKAMGSTFKRRDQEEFLKRQKFTNPTTYSMPQFILNHGMGQFRQSSFRDVWKHPDLIAREYATRRHPWKFKVDQLAQLKVSRPRKRKHGDVGSSRDA